MMSASKTLKKNLSIAVTAVFLAVAAFACWAIEPSKAYADTTDSHLTVASEVHVLVDSEGNVTIPNATVTNDGTCAAYIMGCSSPDGLGWTCDAVGKRIEVGQSLTATWRSAGPVSDEIAAQLGEEPYYAGNLTYTYTDGDLKGTVSLDNTDPTVGDTITATVTGANVPDDKLTYQWVKVKDGSETSIDGATGSTYTATDDDAGYELVCKVSSTDDICLGTISGATGAVKKIQAFAVYSADDGSLNFYKRSSVPSAGEQFNGKTVTAVYTGIEDNNAPGWQPWRNYAPNIKTATIVDDGIHPKTIAYWFNSFSNMTHCDLSKLDVSNTTSMQWTFGNCKALTSLSTIKDWDTSNVTNLNCVFLNCKELTAVNELSSWDVSNVTKMSNMFYGCSSLASVGDLSNWDTSKVTSMSGMFDDCSSLTDLSSIASWNVSKVTSMSSMFDDCSKLPNLDLSGWNPASITDTGISQMFDGCSSLASIKGISSWDTSNITTMYGMFWNCRELVSLDLSGWDCSKVTSTSVMFTNCRKLQEITVGDKWQWVAADASGYLPTPSSQYITGATGKWYADSDGAEYAPKDVPGQKADTYYASKDLVPGITISGNAEVGETLTATVNNLSEDEVTGYQWYTVDDSNTETAIANATAHTYTVTANEVGKKILCKAFYKNGSATKNVKTTPTDNVTPQKPAFAVYSADDGSLNFYKRSGVPAAGEQFEGKTVTAVYTGIETMTSCPWSGYASNIKTATVVDDGLQPCNMDGWFDGCKIMTACDLGKLDTSNVTNMCYLFEDCSSLTTLDLTKWDTSRVRAMNSMFSYCSKLTTVGDISGWNTCNVTRTDYMFSNCSSLTSLDLSKWDTSNVTDMRYMFRFTAALVSVDLSGWDTSSLTDATEMFYICSSLTSLDLSGWNTSNVTYMNSMFYGCSKLTSVGDLSSWDTSSVISVGSMFKDCTKLISVGNLSNWDTSNIRSTGSMFRGCACLTSIGNISNWNTSQFKEVDFMFYNCSSLTTLGDLSGWDTSSLTDASYMFLECSRLSADCSSWDVSKVTNHGRFNESAPGVILPLAWQTSSDEGGEDSAIAPLCEEQGNRDALSVPSENDNDEADEAASKADNEPSVDGATKGNADTSAGDADAKEEETPGDVAQEDPIAA